MEQSKSEQAFEAWYLKQEDSPMPSDCWEAAVEWVKKFLLEEKTSLWDDMGFMGDFVGIETIEEELTK